MKRDNEHIKRRNHDIYARFKQLQPGCTNYQKLYCQIGYEFYLSEVRVAHIIYEMSHAHTKNMRFNKS